MNAMSEQIRATLETIRYQVDNAVAQVTVPYVESGMKRNWTGVAVALPLQGQAQYMPDGKLIREGYTLTVDWSTLDPRKPEEGDLIYLQFPNEDRFTCVIRGTTTLRSALLTMTVERQFN